MTEEADLGIVGETALTPLYAKAHATDFVPDCEFEDALAVDILDRLRVDLDRVLTDHGNAAGAIHRTIAFDQTTIDFVSRHANARIITAGVGLCTRHSRLAERVPDGVDWIGLDTDDVIALRQRVVPDDPVDLTSGSIAEPGWAEGIDANRPTLILAEGVLMYLDPRGLETFLTDARDHFGPGTEIVADYFHPKIALSDRHPIVKATGARFLSGARNGEALAALVPGFGLVDEYPVMELLGLAQRSAARAFRTATRGGRMYAVAHLRVHDRETT